MKLVPAFLLVSVIGAKPGKSKEKRLGGCQSEETLRWKNEMKLWKRDQEKWRFEFVHWLQAQGIDHEFDNFVEDQEQFVTDGESVKWSEVKKSGRCSEEEECTIEKGENWILDESMRVFTLTIYGSLKWDTSKDDLKLSAKYVIVKDGGSFELGNEDEPMDNKATIYIETLLMPDGSKWNPHEEPKDPESHPGFHAGVFGSRFFGGQSGSSIKIHGRKLERTWTLLSTDAEQGITTLETRDDPLAMGWRVGDLIGLAKTTMNDSGRGQQTKIVEIQPFKVIVQDEMEALRLGGVRDVEGYQIEMATEVINLSRNVLLTGDYDRFNETDWGWHSLNVEGGVFDIRYSRFENCGVKDHLGRYCSHFHLSSTCPDCKMIGNAYENAIQSAVTIHGTHRSLVDQNVMWNSRTTCVYIEDGNEMNNTISENVGICNRPDSCGQTGLLWEDHGEGAIYAFGMTNDFINNRMTGYVYGFWTPGGTKSKGRGHAFGKVCPQHTPFGIVKGNVFHDNSLFGIYVDNQSPRNLQRDSNGYVIDNLKSCGPFDDDGNYNGETSVIEDQLDYHNTYSGGYFFGDIVFERLITVNQVNNLYWKTSINPSDPTKVHIKDSAFLNDGSDDKSLLRLLLPGGNHVFKMKNVTFAGSRQAEGEAVIMAPQSCGVNKWKTNDSDDRFMDGMATMCNVHYDFEDVDFSKVGNNDKWVGFSSVVGTPTAPVYTSQDGSLDGNYFVISSLLNGFEKIDGCNLSTDDRFKGEITCDKEKVKIARLIIWTSTSMGTIKLGGPGYDVEPNNENITYTNQLINLRGLNAGYLDYDYPELEEMRPDNLKYEGGYGAHVILGETYRLGDIGGTDAYFKLYDLYPADDQQSAEIELNLCFGEICQTCTLTKDNRKWISNLGVDERAEHNECGRVYNDLRSPVI